MNNNEKHPKGLYVLFFTEMWERFSFYSMIAMFTLYLQDPKQGFGWTAAQATSLYSTYLMFVYGSPLIGGWIADKKLGYLKAVMLGGLFVARLHVEQRKVGVNELFLGAQLLGFMAFGDGGGEIAFPIKRHAEGELRIEMRRIAGEDGAQFLDARVVITLAEGEHGIVVLFLERLHQNFALDPIARVYCAPRR